MFKKRIREVWEVILAVVIWLLVCFCILYPFSKLCEWMGLNWLAVGSFMIGLYFIARFIKWLAYEPFTERRGKNGN